MELLPELVVDKIAQKHIAFYEDYLSFATVCRYWHQIALRAAKTKFPNSNGPPSRLPSLMLAEKKADHEFRELFLLSNHNIRRIRLPEVYGNKICMSSRGWLATVGDDHATQLINPLSRQTINLPKIDTFPRFLQTSDWYNGIRKLLFLSGLVVVLWGCSGKLGFCRIGDNTWTNVEWGWVCMMYDITYYDGLVYSFDCKGYIRACDTEDPALLITISRLPEDVYNYRKVVGAYVVGLDDDDGRKRLLVVIREGMHDAIQMESLELCQKNYKTKSFQVLQYDLELKRWSKVKDMGMKTLFVGFNSSFWIEDTSGVIKSNCIYFTDDVCMIYHGSKCGGGRDMGIYHLSDGTIEPHFTGHSRSNLIPPIWLEPNDVARISVPENSS